MISENSKSRAAVVTALSPKENKVRTSVLCTVCACVYLFPQIAELYCDQYTRPEQAAMQVNDDSCLIFSSVMSHDLTDMSAIAMATLRMIYLHRDHLHPDKAWFTAVLVLHASATSILSSNLFLRRVAQ